MSDSAQRLGLGRPCANRCCRRSNGETGKGRRGRSALVMSPRPSAWFTWPTPSWSPHTGGAGAAVQVARGRRGTQFDPELVDCFGAQPAEILAGLGGISAWEEVIALDPGLGTDSPRTTWNGRSLPSATSAH